MFGFTGRIEVEGFLPQGQLMACIENKGDSESRSTFPLMTNNLGQDNVVRSIPKGAQLGIEFEKKRIVTISASDFTASVDNQLLALHLEKIVDGFFTHRIICDWYQISSQKMRGFNPSPYFLKGPIQIQQTGSKLGGQFTARVYPNGFLGRYTDFFSRAVSEVTSPETFTLSGDDQTIRTLEKGSTLLIKYNGENLLDIRTETVFSLSYPDIPPGEVAECLKLEVEFQSEYYPLVITSIQTKLDGSSL